MTLIELLLVMAIVGALLGVGVGALSRLATPERVAAGQLLDVLAAARQLARDSGAPSLVVVEPGEGRLIALGQSAVGNWHFETEDGTGWPVAAQHAGAVLTAQGVIGSALDLRGEGELSIPDLPAAADSPEGFAVELWLSPAAEPRPMTLIERPGRFRVALSAEDRLELTLYLAAEARAEEFRLEAPGALPADRWTRLLVSFNGRVLHLARDGLPALPDTHFSPPRLLAATQGPAPLQTGTGLLRFRGLLDEVRLAAVRTGARALLPPEVSLQGPARVLHFDSQGRLNSERHRGPERIAILAGDPPQPFGVDVSLFGQVTSWSGSP